MPCLEKTEYGEQVSFSHLAIDISRRRASCCAEQPPVSMGGSVPRKRQENTGVAQAESKNPYLNQECGLMFRVIGEEQILCFARLYTSASDWSPHDQVEASFSIFFLLLRVAEPHPWMQLPFRFFCMRYHDVKLS